jgi:hypothetical protein
MRSSPMRRVDRAGNHAPCRADERLAATEIAALEPGSRNAIAEPKGGKRIAEMCASYAPNCAWLLEISGHRVYRVL